MVTTAAIKMPPKPKFMTLRMISHLSDYNTFFSYVSTFGGRISMPIDCCFAVNFGIRSIAHGNN